MKNTQRQRRPRRENQKKNTHTLKGGRNIGVTNGYFYWEKLHPLIKDRTYQDKFTQIFEKTHHSFYRPTVNQIELLFEYILYLFEKNKRLTEEIDIQNTQNKNPNYLQVQNHILQEKVEELQEENKEWEQMFKQVNKSLQKSQERCGHELSSPVAMDIVDENTNPNTTYPKKRKLSSSSP